MKKLINVVLLGLVALSGCATLEAQREQYEMSQRSLLEIKKTECQKDPSASFCASLKQ
jgi:outer membrane protein assembly factor BamE (lipoprotein component of BamABCDE complex)